MSDYQILTGDCLEVLRGMADESVHLCCTSPPYYGQRVYLPEGHPLKAQEIGSEKTPGEYVQHLVAVFSEVRRVLRRDGTIWLNLGDGYEAKNLLMMPARVALALQANGWYLRQQCTWIKRNAMPDSTSDRPPSATETVFLLSRSPRYFYDQPAVAVTAVGKNPGNKSHKYANGDERLRKIAGLGGVDAVETRNRRNSDWWFDSLRVILAGENRILLDEQGDPLAFPVDTQGCREAHFAVMPEALIEPCVKAGTSLHGCCGKCGAPWKRKVHKERVATRPGRNTKVVGDSAREGNRDPGRHVTRTVTLGWAASCRCEAGEPVPATVLDPFAGAGTVGLVSLRLGRRFIGIELNEEYAALAGRRLESQVAMEPLFAWLEGVEETTLFDALEEGGKDAR